MSNKYDVVLFDFDGTIADTAKGIFKGINHVFDSMGIDRPKPESLRNFIGPPLSESFKTILGLNDTQCESALVTYREYYSDTGLFELTLYDGIEELFRKLKEQNIKMGICSAKPEVFLKRLVIHLEMTDLFEAVTGSDIHYVHSDKALIIKRAMEIMHLPADAKVLMVGDRYLDINGAKKAGIDSAGVLFGYGSREEFENAGADYIVADTDELFEIIADA
jgi:phosphoglycolate phosphatase